MRLTPVAKGFITLIILAVVGYVAWYRMQGRPNQHHDSRAAIEPRTGAASHEHDHDHDHAAAGRSKKNAKIVVGISEFGGAYSGLVANEGLTPGPGSRFTTRGLQVEFKLIRDPKERLAAFEHGEIDVMLMTLDHMAYLEPTHYEKGLELRAFLMTGWSRGNLGIVAAPKVRSIEDLRDVKVATTRNSEGHFLLLMMLRDSNLGPADIDRVRSSLIYATKPAFALDMFTRGDVVALATTEPYLSQALAGSRGHLLISTATATNLIAEILCARADFLRDREADVIALTSGWLDGVAMAARDPQGSAQHFAQAVRLPVTEVQQQLSKIKLATFADNREFFGLEHEHALYMSLFDEAEKLWRREGLIKRQVPAAETRWLHALEALAKEHAGEKVHEDFQFRGGPRKDARPLLTKSVTIYFASGTKSLDTNARKIIEDFAEELEQFGNAYIRVEGHTDSVGSREKNIALSQDRAQVVIDDLVTRRGFDRSRFQAVGHGADKPKGDNATQTGRDMNRRTDFMILQNE